jgi:hypothetical protein
MTKLEADGHMPLKTNGGRRVVASVVQGDSQIENDLRFGGTAPRVYADQAAHSKLPLHLAATMQQCDDGGRSRPDKTDTGGLGQPCVGSGR